jgi:hypothetical protein
VAEQVTIVEPPTGWWGWRRERGGTWVLVATGETEKAVSDRLFDLMSGSRGHHDWLTLPAGMNP